MWLLICVSWFGSSFELLNLQAQEKGLSLTYSIKEDICTTVLGDPTRLRQILLNLLGNALKFTAKGKVSLDVDRISESDENIQLRFSVHVTGIGISSPSPRPMPPPPDGSAAPVWDWPSAANSQN